MHVAKDTTVFVGLSGGVDSSVAAARLQVRGYTVVGVFIKVWHPDWMKCNWEQERLDAMRVAAHLGIPFLTCDAEGAYRDDVAEYFISEYQAGRTPNPDVLCNQQVKFGRFLDFAKAKGADYIATGHYVQHIEGKNGIELHRGVDNNKDQSYFLWSLSTQQLSAALFPVGDTPKADIRAEAENLGIPVAQKKDSQGICFLGHVDIAEFLSHYVDLVPGDVLDTTGAVVGTHQGALVYTLGQRHGFTTNTADSKRTPQFVVAKNVANNTITIADTVPTSDSKTTISLDQLALRTEILDGATIELQTRYRQTPIPATLTHYTEHSCTISPHEPFDTPAPGQSCVLYQGSLCLGGGIIVWMGTIITKADGTTEHFKVEKLRRSLRRAGAKPDEINAVVADVHNVLYDGMQTQEIYRHAFALLRAQQPPAATRYSLRRALFNLGPTGFPFETFLARLFATDGYETKTGITIQGKCAAHEIDVAAYKEDHSFIGEAKFHARLGIKSDLQVAMYSYARFLDLQEKRICNEDICGISEFWLITNTKFTSTAEHYATCVGLKLLSWDFPKNNNLHDRIQRAGVYPITVIQSLSAKQLDTLISRGVILCRDLLAHEGTLRHLHLSKRKHEAVMQEAREVCDPKT